MPSNTPPPHPHSISSFGTGRSGIVHAKLVLLTRFVRDDLHLSYGDKYMLLHPTEETSAGIGKRMMSGIFPDTKCKCGYGSLCGELVMIDTWVGSFQLGHTYRLLYRISPIKAKPMDQISMYIHVCHTRSLSGLMRWYPWTSARCHHFLRES